MNTSQLRTQATPFLWGAAAGAISLAIVGFNWGGWVTGGTAEKLAGERSEKALVSALVPICVDQFKESANATASLAALKATKSWEQSDYVSKGGWATMPGSADQPKREIATACAEALSKLVLPVSKEASTPHKEIGASDKAGG